MNRMLRMKIQDGRRRDERCRFKYVSTGEKIRLHFWTQWNIASNFIVPKVRGFFSDVSNKKKAIWQMIANDMKKNGYSSSYLFTRKIAKITAAMAASSSAAIFVTQCLLMPGPRISTDVFLCRQSELFLAFRTNHSYSRIVDKKRALRLVFTTKYFDSTNLTQCRI